MVAGGIGITPLLSMVRFLNERHVEDRREVKLLYSAASRQELLMHEELLAIAKQNADFGYYPTLSDVYTADQSWNGTCQFPVCDVHDGGVDVTEYAPCV